MDKKYFKPILLIFLLVVICFSGYIIYRIYNFDKKKTDVSGNDIVSNEIKEISVTNDPDSEFSADYNIKVGENIIIDDLSSSKIVSNSNPEIISIEDNGNVIGISSGFTEVKYLSNNVEKKITIEVAEIETSKAAGILKWDCQTRMNVKIEEKGKSMYKNLYKCLSNFQLENVDIKEGNSNSRGMQNFAVTTDSVYFSSRGSTKGNGSSKGNIGKQFIFKRSKANLNNYSSMSILHSGHGQSFDVVYSQANDIVFASDYAKVNDEINYSTSNFYFGNSKSLSSVSLKNLGSSNYGKTAENVTNKSNSSVTGNKKNIKFLDVATNYGGARIAFFRSYNDEPPSRWFEERGSRVFIYSLDKPNDLSTMKFKRSFDVKYKGLRQGVEICGDYLYVWTEYRGKDYERWKNTGSHSISLYTYNIVTGELLNVSTLTDGTIKSMLSSLYLVKKDKNGNQEKINWDPKIHEYEAEGLSIYGNQPYIGITFTYLPDSKYQNRQVKYNNIFKFS